jgi:hypothetical protein
VQLVLDLVPQSRAAQRSLDLGRDVPLVAVDLQAEGDVKPAIVGVFGEKIVATAPSGG